MAVPFTLPLQSQVTDENALTTLADVKNEINNNNITTSNNTFTGSNTFQGPVTFENQNYIDVKVPYIELWNLNAAWNVTPSTRTEAAYSCKDKNGITMGALSLARETNGDTTISFHLHAPNGTWSQPGQVLTQIAKADGTLESRASEPPSDANDSRIATCKFVIDKINAIPEIDLTGYVQNTAAGSNSLAIHPKDAPWTYASGTMSIAIGAGSSDSSVSAAGQFALAMCPYAQATGDYAISIGGSSSATKSQNVSIGYNADTIYDYSTAIGGSAQAGGMGATCLGRDATANAANTVAIGYKSKAQQTGTTAIGMNAQALYTGGTAIGVGADVLSGGAQATAIGYQAQAGGAQAIQLGYGTNSDAKTFKVGFYDSSTPTNYELLDENGNIPGERMSLQGTTAPDTTTVGSIGQFYVDTTTTTGYMCVAVDTVTPSYTWKQITYSPVGTEYILEAGNWNAENNSIEISIPGLTIGTPMWIAPTVSEDNSNELNYTTHGIRLKAQQADSIILSCTIIPTENISITIIR